MLRMKSASIRAPKSIVILNIGTSEVNLDFRMLSRVMEGRWKQTFH